MTEIPSNDGVPLDDYGVHNDHMLDVCEKLVMQLWERVVNEEQKLSIPDIKDAALTLDSLWNLIQSIMDMDDSLNGSDDINDIDDSQDASDPN